MKLFFKVLLVLILLVQMSAKQKLHKGVKKKAWMDIINSNSNSDSKESPDIFEDGKDPNFKHRKIMGINMKGTFNKKFAVTAAYRQSEMNLVCSPISGFIPLGKLALGATRGSRTLTELLKAIGVDSRFDVADLFSRLINTMRNLPGVTLNLASRLYISTKYEIQSKFHSEVRAIFKSSCEKVNFDDPSAAARKINDWVSSETLDKIKQIIRPDQVSPNSAIVLVNAVYFQGQWMYPFSSHVGNFMTPVGTKKVMMMYQSRKIPYYKSSFLNAQLIELPYQEGRASMVVVLPTYQNGLKELLSIIKLSPNALNTAYKKMVRRHVLVNIPRFKAESTLDLNVLYEIVGLKAMFEDGIGEIVRNEMLKVSLAIQKAVIEVDEGGTEAAAITAVETVTLSAQLNVRKRFIANHSFLYLVMAESHQLFAGIFTGVG